MNGLLTSFPDMVNTKAVFVYNSKLKCICLSCQNTYSPYFKIYISTIYLLRFATKAHNFKKIINIKLENAAKLKSK